MGRKSWPPLRGSILDHDAELGLEVVDGVIFDNRHADFEREENLVSQVEADREIRGQKQPSRLPRNRIPIIDADVIAQIERTFPPLIDSD